jgi:hypothetical protein
MKRYVLVLCGVVSISAFGKSTMDRPTRPASRPTSRPSIPPLTKPELERKIVELKVKIPTYKKKIDDCALGFGNKFLDLLRALPDEPTAEEQKQYDLEVALLREEFVTMQTSNVDEFEKAKWELVELERRKKNNQFK